MSAREGASVVKLREVADSRGGDASERIAGSHRPDNRRVDSKYIASFCEGL